MFPTAIGLTRHRFVRSVNSAVIDAAQVMVLIRGSISAYDEAPAHFDAMDDRDAGLSRSGSRLGE